MPTERLYERSAERAHIQRTALLSLGAAVVLIAIKLAAGLASGSLAILSEAAHSALDAGATGITYFAVRIASRPPDEDHPYGHGKAENISALIETFGLLALSAFIAGQAIVRLQGQGAQPRATWYGFAVIGVSIIIDFSRSRALGRAGRKYHSPALQADALHFTADLLTSAIVLIGLIFLRFGVTEADAIGSLLIAAYVAFSSVLLGRRSIDVLMDRAPTGTINRIEETAAAVPGVAEVRRVRFRYVGGQPQADIVVAISRSTPLESAHEVTERLEEAVRFLQPGTDVVVHVEPLADEAAIADIVRMIAAREPRITEVHNVLVTSGSDGLHISLHIKMEGTMVLQDAHAISDQLEASIARGVPGTARVDTHVEPLEKQESIIDVTAVQSELVDWARTFAERQPEVRDCHEIVVTDSGGDLTMVMHCHAGAGLAVAAVHEASTRIESAVHARWTAVKRVTVHFEPD